MGLYVCVFRNFTLLDTLGLALGKALAGFTTLPVGSDSEERAAWGRLRGP